MRRPSRPSPKALDPLPHGTQAVLRQGYEAIAYHIRDAPLGVDERVLKTTIVLPPRSIWSSGVHFHRYHTEHLRLVKGSIFVELDGKLIYLSAAAGGQISTMTGEPVKEGLEIVVNRYVRHNWGRAEGYRPETRLHRYRNFVRPKDFDKEIIVEEWTDPSDIDKPLFFWNLNGIITAPLDTPLPRMQAMARLLLGSWWIPFQLFIVFWDLDNWPVFLRVGEESRFTPAERVAVRVQRSVEYVATFLVLLLAKILGKILGVDAVSRNRTPTALWQAYNKGGI